MSIQPTEKKQLFQSLIRRAMILIGIKILIISFFFFHFLEKSKLSPQKPQMCYQERCFDLEIADTPAKRELGLMFRESLPETSGMLFVFESAGIHSFWMRNTLIPLDILWLDEENSVIDLISAPPCKEMPCPSYLPSAEATQAIELNSGTAAKLGLQIGEKVEIRR
ncbi:MAG: hypothetical protein DLD55_03265 [candidate division SR1 bacterium]|nr:MAG: hypothetical protein DLD55_03265 [candidate division SR1 bacterium]